ncbi:hypothetical protein C1H46_041743 [Malus baccata]|uniref:glucan endo-1,3-beta-D-glucosidase n=1 Tax=Malus baccata TaxID=106549 RepID=A0A540KER4_MALBA|nr:hypothetical protein C1H46_041743 [Malus baccata]
MKALSSTGIGVMVGIPNEKLNKLAHDYATARKWVKQNVTAYLHNGGVTIRYVAVRNKPFLTSYNGTYVKNEYPLSGSSGFPKEFAFFDGGGKTVRDNGDPYNNVFDANYDTLLWALKKAGVPNLDIVIGEVGWPIDGHDYGSKKSAKKFYDGLLKLASQVGTLLRKGYLEVYLFGLFDEDQKSVAQGTLNAIGEYLAMMASLNFPWTSSSLFFIIAFFTLF